MSNLSIYRKIVEEIDHLPPLPAITSKLIQTVNSSDSSAEDAAALIEGDPALTGAILKLANSAFYGRPRSVSSVASAVVVLGFNTIRSIVLGLSVAKAFSNTNKKCFDRNRFWLHSITAGIAGRIIARRVMPYSDIEPETVFCGAIIHDIGKLIFEEFINSAYYKVVNLSIEKNVSLYRAENAILGITHAGIGTILADKWALPQDLESAIVYHHEPWNCKYSEDMAAAVYLSDILAFGAGASVTEDVFIPSVDKRVLEILSLDMEEVDECRLELYDEREKAEEFLMVLG